MAILYLQICQLYARLGPTSTYLGSGSTFPGFFLDYSHGVFDWVVQQSAIEGARR